jgi:large conductance mechanosensitive channel
LNLAVGLIIGTAFSNLVKSFAEDVLTPPFGLLIGGVDFSNLTIRMPNFVYKNQPPVVIRYGKFIGEVIGLLIMALILFFIIKSVNKLQELATKKQAEEASRVKLELSDEGKILIQIRDILLTKTVVVDGLRF